ncbi:MAG: DUF370 domain-containing protein [Acidobacteria bacterium]|nr:DUF370 domain-containing protein [Acidobacteriota bacterium]
MRLVNIGFGNAVTAERVIAVVAPHSAPIKRMREEARREGRLIDATGGKKTRSVIVTDSNHIVLSSVHINTVVARLQEEKK